MTQSGHQRPHVVTRKAWPWLIVISRLRRRRPMGLLTRAAHSFQRSPEIGNSWANDLWRIFGDQAARAEPGPGL